MEYSRAQRHKVAARQTAELQAGSSTCHIGQHARTRRRVRPCLRLRRRSWCGRRRTRWRARDRARAEDGRHVRVGRPGRQAEQRHDDAQSRAKAKAAAGGGDGGRDVLQGQDWGATAMESKSGVGVSLVDGGVQVVA